MNATGLDRGAIAETSASSHSFGDEGIMVATRRLSARGRAAPQLAWQRYEQIALWPTWSPSSAV